MQYSYECWPQQPFQRKEENATSTATAVLEERPLVMEQDSVAQHADALHSLEKALPFTLEEGLQAYQQHQVQPQVGLWASTPSVEEAHWDDFAKLVADHVLAYMLDHPLKDELEALKQQNAQAEKDNRLLSQQIRELALENSALRVTLHKAEHELAQYTPVAGGFFKKGG